MQRFVRNTAKALKELGRLFFCFGNKQHLTDTNGPGSGSARGRRGQLCPVCAAVPQEFSRIC